MKSLFFLLAPLTFSCVSPKVNGHWRPSSDVLGRIFSRPDSARRDSLVRVARRKTIKINHHE